MRLEAENRPAEPLVEGAGEQAHESDEVAALESGDSKAATPEDGRAEVFTPYWPSFALKDLVTATTVTIVVVLLAIFLVPRQIVTDPIYRTSLPSPDWLYLFYVLPYMYIQGDWHLPALLSIPPLAVLLLLLVPFVQRDNPKTARSRRRRKILVVGLSVLVIGLAFTTTAYTGSRVPAQGCEACHRPRMVGAPPSEVKNLGHRDSQWIARHLVDPQYWWMH